ncbi:acyl-CoA thioesterase [Lysinibacter cavernae]|uniref:Acyl-CoA thioester hydrolase n=1 Tax=Lysinibacter cavernae TaxID=1640652 RepID=A0A7X5R089_9MICO|nr:thioesterase family protein [Lysinibacter cavernae]NIH53045.1 acyl-CoA thioester hydrolase [Lysinibacter cavernae]
MRDQVILQLRWADLDAYGHVNNAVMLRLLEEARIRWMWKPAGGTASRDSQIFDASPTSDTIMVIAHQEIEYRAVLPYLDEGININVWIGAIGGSSLDLYYEIYGAAGAEAETLYVRASSTVVVMDAAAQKPRRLSTDERAAMQPYLGEPLQLGRKRG